MPARHASTMKLGVVLPFGEPDGSPLAVGGLAAGARRIEAAGFDSAWVFDALGRGFLLPDPLAALATAAAATEPDRAGHRRAAAAAPPSRRPGPTGGHLPSGLR